MKKKPEEINCIDRFIPWYNAACGTNFEQELAITFLPELKDKLNWDYVAYEPNDLKKWIGIEIKELSTVEEKTDEQFVLWKEVCSELNRYLEAHNIEGTFDLFPSNIKLNPRKKVRLARAIGDVLVEKQKSFKADEYDEYTDIGPDVSAKFKEWPEVKSEDLEDCFVWGDTRPAELKIMKIENSGHKVILPTGPIVEHDHIQINEDAFNKVFKTTKGVKHANKQLELAKGKGAIKTILLLAGSFFADEELIGLWMQGIDKTYISNIDEIYFVDITSENKPIICLFGDNKVR